MVLLWKDILDKYSKALKEESLVTALIQKWGQLQDLLGRRSNLLYRDQTASLDFEKKKMVFYLNSLHIYNIRFEGEAESIMLRTKRWRITLKRKRR